MSAGRDHADPTPPPPAGDALRTLVARLMATQEAERHALARALHDDIGQQLAAIKLGAMALQDEDDGAAARAELVGEIIATAEQTVAALRELSARLRPPSLEALGLEAALRWQADRLAGHGPRVVLALSPLPRRPAPTVELAAFRIAEEAIANAFRHAKADEVNVSLAPAADLLLLAVRDDGRGFAPATTEGAGLSAMRVRAAQAGGELEIDAAPGRGTCIRARVPFGR